MKPSQIPVLSITITAILAGCEPRYLYTDCLLPTMDSDVPIDLIMLVGDPQDRASDTCTPSLARTFEMRRAYGTIKFEWWGSPHRLYLRATRSDGQALAIRGDGIEVYENASGSWLSEYSHRKTFPVENLLLSDRPDEVPFTVEIVADGQLIDVIGATYRAQLCSCSVPEALAR